MDEATKEKLKKNVFVDDDDDAQFHWCLTGMSHEIGDERVEELLKMCIDKCISIGGKGVADNIQEFSTGKAKALRKTLF